MRWRCATGIFHRSAVFSRRTSALLHLTIWLSESDGPSESHLRQQKQPAFPVAYLAKTPIQAVMEAVLFMYQCATIHCRGINSTNRRQQHVLFTCERFEPFVYYRRV
jgi:hypothetical protein